jgi:hypothetical protein
MSSYPKLSWRVLNPTAQAGSDRDRVVAILYTVAAYSADGDEWLEFCCLLTGPPEHDVEVLFGVAAGTGAAWDSRWDRGRAASEYVYAEPLPPASP